ncbi:metallophosphoesterase [Mycolicibacterium mengxianglii]|uniref:metallophosphoesterase n=1 Tax=Mycolicibacterium mengxianglii TaxID=2736649 RepID=UPI0018D1B26B|nr:metallophosphoesterase [Mycolicibacterium mengxianglii]
MDARGFDGYDIVGDVHGCATELEALLDVLDYRQDSLAGPYEHPRRRAIFVGDLIDRGSGQRRVLEVVKAMVDAGSAQMVLGNHEFNALAYATEWPVGSGKYLRPHDDPSNLRSAKNETQHRVFLEQVLGDERTYYLDWLRTQPLWLDLGDIRVVHACWHEPSIAILERELGADRFSAIDQLVRASTEGDPLYLAVETLLKGPEISLVDHGQVAYVDKDGISRHRARVRWWNGEAATLRDIAEMGGGFTTDKGDPYPPLPVFEVPGEHRSHIYTDQVPVFYGHYWRRGTPRHQHDWTDYTACVDFSAVDGGALTAYRWSGEGRVDPQNYVSVQASGTADA